MMTPEQQYPSTEDCGMSLVECLRNARERIVMGHTKGAYISDGKVCAVGAVFAALGATEMYWAADGPDVDIESRLCAQANEAIELLNDAALELHPEAENYETWSGPLEWVNQTSSALASRVKLRVLAIYDLAIERALA